MKPKVKSRNTQKDVSGNTYSIPETLNFRISKEDAERVNIIREKLGVKGTSEVLRYALKQAADMIGK